MNIVSFTPYVYSYSSMDKQMCNTVSTMFPGKKVSLLLGWCQHLLQFFADVRYVWGPGLFTINDDIQKFGITTIILFPSINISFMDDRGTHFGVKCMNFVLSVFRESLLDLTHAYMLALSLLVSETISLILYPVAKRFVSSAKTIGMETQKLGVNHWYTIRKVWVQE